MTQLWSIGDPDGAPGKFGAHPFYERDRVEVVFRVGVDELSSWPAIQPGPLDRDGGYRSHTVVVVFGLDEVPAQGADLQLLVEAVSGPMPHLLVELNGHCGEIFLDARRDEHPRLHFRSVVGGWMRLDVPVPAECLVAGENRLALRTVCHDVVDPNELGEPFAGVGSGFGSVLRWGGLAMKHRTEAMPPVSLDLVPTPLFRHDGDELVDVLVTGSVGAGRLDVQLPDLTISVATSALAFGRRRIRLAVPEPAGPVGAVLTISDGERSVQAATTLQPCRKWTLHLIPHVHLDVGYTDYQAKVVELHSRNVDRALALRTKEPDYSFWVDGSFVVAQWLQSRAPSQRNALIDALQSGRLGVNAYWFLFLTGLASLEECYRAGWFAERLRREFEVDLDAANLTDVPSYSSALPSVLQAIGVDHFLGIANHTRAASPSTEELHRISPFRWRGPDGAEVTAFLARHYSQLRYLAAHPPTVAGCADGFSRLCHQYERDDYAPADLPVVGINNDNEDLGRGEVDIVARWSRAYAWPKLRFSTANDYFRAVAGCREQLPVIEGDGGSYWEDGVGSQAAAVATYREAQALLPAAESLAALLSLRSPALRPAVEAFDAGWEQLLIGCEHTWTSAHATTHPHSHQTVDQLDWKVSQVRSAHRAAVDETRRAMSQLGELAITDGHSLVVHNPLPWARSGDVWLDGDVRSPRRAYVDAVPPLGYRVLRHDDVRPEQENAVAIDDGVHAAGSYTLTLRDGQVVGLRHDRSGRELVDSASAWGLGQVLYVAGGGTEDGLGMGDEATSLFGVDWHLPEPDLQVHPCVVAETRLATGGASWSLLMAWSAPSVRGTTVLRGRVDSDVVTVEVCLDKERVRAKESVYIAFPFQATEPRFRYDRQQGWVDPALDHQPGACHEWLTLQHAVLVDGDEGGIAWSSAHAPLFCIDDVVRGRWPDRLLPQSGTVLSWPMNNYWWTNYAGSQSGSVLLRYAFSPVSRGDLTAAARLGRELRMPLIAQDVHRLDKSEDGGVLPQSGSLLELDLDDNVSASAVIARWSDGVILRLQELAGQPGQATLRLPDSVTTVRLVDAREATLDTVSVRGRSVTVDVAPHGVRHLLLERR